MLSQLDGLVRQREHDISSRMAARMHELQGMPVNHPHHKKILIELMSLRLVALQRSV